MLHLLDLPRLALALALAVTMGAAAAPARATGLGAAASAAPQLGQPLDFTVPLRIAAGESLAPDCVEAVVAYGERVLPAPAVRTVLETLAADAARLRVTATPPLDEPVVTVSVGAGCASRVTRRYVLFAEPPERSAAAPASEVAAPAFAAAPLPVAGEALVASSAARRATPPAKEAARAARATRLSDAGRAGTRARAAAAERARSARRATQGPRVAVRQATPRRPRRAASPLVPVALQAAAPRLLLEAAVPVASPDAQAVEQALEAVARAASAARAAASAASASAERIAALERTVGQLRAQAATQDEQAARLAAQLAASDRPSRWLAPLVALVLLLAGLAAWLAWRLAAAQRRREVDWRQAVARPPAAAAAPAREPTAPIPLVTSEIAPASPQAQGYPAWPPPAAPAVPEAGAAAAAVDERRGAPASEPAMERTQVLAGPGQAEGAAARDVSVDELIDLEQQAEFFVVLGQDEAAIDLLVEHLRSTGGGSALPYLKLLEIYHRRGEREAYERTRARFNRRFNAYAPEWGADLAHGRTLEDYPAVLPRLERAWPQPIDAMAELETLLFRKARGELFELPAYRDVLFLYALARDRLDREALAGGSVDLLLPLGDAGPAAALRPEAGLDADGAGAHDDRATAPVDLDLSRSDWPSSIFDAVDEPARRP